MSKLSDALASKTFVVTSELTPPKGTDLGPLFAKAELLKPYATAINLTESHAARMAMDPVAVGHLLLDHGVEPIVQMTSRDKNRLAIQASILGASALGIPNVVFMGGDPPKNGDHPDAKPVFDLFASQLLEAVQALNNGTDLSGAALNQSTHLFAGAVANPGASDLQAEIDNLNQQIGILTNVFKQIKPWSAIMEELAAVTPPQIQIHGFGNVNPKREELGGNWLGIAGTTDNYTRVNDYILSLKNSDLVNSGQVSLFGATTIDNPNGYTFSGVTTTDQEDDSNFKEGQTITLDGIDSLISSPNTTLQQEENQYHLK